MQDNIVLENDFKMCNKCKKVLHRDEFYNKANSKDGKATYCKTCCKISARKSREKHKLKEQVRIKDRYEEFEKNIEDLNAVKTCIRCKVEKNITLFHVEKKEHDFRSKVCIECKKIRAQENELKRLEQRGY